MQGSLLPLPGRAFGIGLGFHGSRISRSWLNQLSFQAIATLGLQIAQSMYYLQTLDPKVGTICILGALGQGSTFVQCLTPRAQPKFLSSPETMPTGLSRSGV